MIQRPQASVSWNQDSVEYNLCFRKVALGTFPKYIGAVGDVNGPVY